MRVAVSRIPRLRARAKGFPIALCKPSGAAFPSPDSATAKHREALEEQSDEKAGTGFEPG